MVMSYEFSYANTSKYLFILTYICNQCCIHATQGVKQKYKMYFGISSIYTQYLHHCSSQVALHLARGGESSICSSAPLAGLRHSSSAAAPGQRSADPQSARQRRVDSSLLFTCWLWPPGFTLPSAISSGQASVSLTHQTKSVEVFSGQLQFL